MSIKKSVGVTLTISGKSYPINGDVKSKYDMEGNLTVSFMIGTTRLEEVKLVFNKKLYLDIQDE